MMRVQNGTESPGPKPSKNNMCLNGNTTGLEQEICNLSSPWVKGSHPLGSVADEAWVYGDLHGAN